MASLAATWMRGGSSKCWVFHSGQLPSDREARGALISRLFGSPDPRQIDGVGGATPTTSKVIVVDVGTSGDGTVEYEFGQVVIDEARVEWVSNCGNCATALGLYAAQEGLGLIADGRSEVRLVNTVTGLKVETDVELRDGTVPNDGPVLVSGVAHPGVGVNVRFSATSWTSPGVALLPSGQPKQVAKVGGVEAAVTLVDAGTPAVFVSGTDLGLRIGAPDLEERLAALVDPLREARSEIRLTVDGWASGAGESIPKIGVVLPAGERGDADVVVRMLTMNRLHPAISITSAAAVTVASAIADSVVSDCVEDRADTSILRIGTRAGTVETLQLRDKAGGLAAVEIRRNARRLADAQLFVPVR